jgi:hypothetical protein
MTEPRGTRNEGEPIDGVASPANGSDYVCGRLRFDLLRTLEREVDRRRDAGENAVADALQSAFQTFSRRLEGDPNCQSMQERLTQQVGALSLSQVPSQPNEFASKERNYLLRSMRVLGTWRRSQQGRRTRLQGWC